MSDYDSIDSLDSQVDALESSMSAAASVTASFDAELGRMRGSLSATGRDVSALSGGFSRGLRNAFDDVVFDGGKLSDALGGLARNMADTAYSAAAKPVFNHVGGMLSGLVGDTFGSALPFAKGAGFAQGRVMPFAKGGVVDSPVTFPMRGATGLMGEAGPEAIMPLTRGPDGSLGVRSQGGGGAVNVVMNISTPDAASFRKSSTQVSAQMSRALSRGQRNR
ncbi:phage tail tape measure protein [Algirhabdus cladophorae]|uniref:phage tail tape measure protein n=1 Tax=Algirhabdus cladophorae TaxID=3377108 RepID=UPI003B84872F